MGAGVRVLIAARARIAGPVLLVLLVACLAGCGGSSKSKSTQTHTTSSSQSTSTAASGGQASVTSGAVRATLHGENSAPIAGKNWVYTVRVTDATGQPLSGTVDTEFTFSGQVVGHETPPTHSLKHGVLTDTIQWPKQAVGQPLSLQTVIHTSKGSVTLDWPVTVRP